jgi:outer membrane protein TolC
MSPAIESRRARRPGKASLTRLALPVVVALLAGEFPVFAQQAAGTPLRLGELQQAAIAADPRLRELELLETQSALRLQNVAVQWRPAISVEGQAQYQSDAPTAPVLVPGGKPVFSAPKENVDISGRVEQRLFDRSIAAQAAVERAQRVEQQARVRTAMFGIRQQVNDAYFAAALLQQRVNVVSATSRELEGRLQEANARVREGTSLPADAAAIEAALLQRQQDESELRANISAALARLATIVGRPIAADAVPVLPDLPLASSVDAAQWYSTGYRPEYTQFTAMRDRIARQSELATAQSQPKLSAFGRVGYGRPALDFIQNEWQPYAVGGVRLQWNAWTWGSVGRERQAQSLQQEIVDADALAFRRSVAVAIEGDRAAIDHLTRALATDRRIIELRTEVERAARVRLQEGVLTSSDYLARDSELLQARIAEATHQVELAQARARLLTTEGVEIR